MALFACALATLIIIAQLIFIVNTFFKFFYKNCLIFHRVV